MIVKKVYILAELRTPGAITVLCGLKRDVPLDRVSFSTFKSGME